MPTRFQELKVERMRARHRPGDDGWISLTELNKRLNERLEAAGAKKIRLAALHAQLVTNPAYSNFEIRPGTDFPDPARDLSLMQRRYRNLHVAYRANTPYVHEELLEEIAGKMLREHEIDEITSKHYYDAETAAKLVGYKSRVAFIRRLKGFPHLYATIRGVDHYLIPKRLVNGEGKLVPFEEAFNGMLGQKAGPGKSRVKEELIPHPDYHYDYDKAREVLGVSSGSLSNAVNRGMPNIKVGRKRYFARELGFIYLPEGKGEPEKRAYPLSEYYQFFRGMPLRPGTSQGESAGSQAAKEARAARAQKRREWQAKELQRRSEEDARRKAEQAIQLSSMNLRAQRLKTEMQAQAARDAEPKPRQPEAPVVTSENKGGWMPGRIALDGTKLTLEKAVALFRKHGLEHDHIAEVSPELYTEMVLQRRPNTVVDAAFRRRLSKKNLVFRATVSHPQYESVPLFDFLEHGLRKTRGKKEFKFRDWS